MFTSLLLTGWGAMAQGQTAHDGKIINGPVAVGAVKNYASTNRTTALGTDFKPAYEAANVVLFYNPDVKPGMTLMASVKEDLTDIPNASGRTARDFTHYKWFYMGNTAGATAAIDGSTFATGLVANGLLVPSTAPNYSNKLVVTNLTEGYHYFKVQGIVNPDNILETELCTIEEEIYVVYVLPQLAVEAQGNLASGITAFQYCETEIGTGIKQEKVAVKATYDFVRPNSPDANLFDVKYRWYAVKASETNVYADVANKAIDPTSIGAGAVKLIETSTDPAKAGVLPDFFPQIAEFGKYKLFVEVEYVAKDRNANEQLDNASTNSRARAHVIYRGFAKDGVNDLVLTVTPTPGKPHITILSVQD